MKQFSILAVVLGCLLAGVARGDDSSSVQDQAHAWNATYHLTRYDLDFLFDSISFRDGEWHFKPSTNVLNMHWRIRNDELDMTGLCESVQSLDFEPGSSLEITRDDLDLLFKPLDATTFQVYLRVRPAGGDFDDVRARETILEPSVSGYRLVSGE